MKRHLKKLFFLRNVHYWVVKIFNKKLQTTQLQLHSIWYHFRRLVYIYSPLNKSNNDRFCGLSCNSSREIITRIYKLNYFQNLTTWKLLGTKNVLFLFSHPYIDIPHGFANLQFKFTSCSNKFFPSILFLSVIILKNTKLSPLFKDKCNIYRM